MTVTEAQLNALLLKAFIGTWTVIIPALGWLIVYFVRKDRNAAFGKLRDHEKQLVAMRVSVDDLDAAVFGVNGEGGVAKWEHRMRNVVQPMTSAIENVESRLDALVLALARAVPGIELKDLRS